MPQARSKMSLFGESDGSDDDDLRANPATGATGASARHDAAGADDDDKNDVIEVVRTVEAADSSLIGRAFINPEVFPDKCAVCYVAAHEQSQPFVDCAECDCVSYCCEEHLQRDSFHVGPCNAWLRLRDMAVKNARDRGKRVSDIKAETASAALEIHDHTLLQLTFHPACKVCRLTDMTRLVNCERCHQVYTCAAHRKQAAHLCDEMQLALEVAKLVATHQGRPVISVPALSARDGIDVPAEYARSDAPVQSWDSFLQAFFYGCGYKAASAAMLSLQTSGFTLPLTAYHCLRQLRGDSVAQCCSALSIQVLGARFTEIIASMCFEMLFHLLPALRQLSVALIGPELQEADFEDPLYTQPARELCVDCRKGGKTLKLTFESATYHQSTSVSAPAVQRPDLVLMPNAGLFLYPEWRESLRLLIDADVATVVTAHDHTDAAADARVARKAGARIVIEAMSNPFRSTVPVRRPDRLGDVIYRNAYLFAFRGRVAAGTAVDSSDSSSSDSDAASGT